MITTHNLYETTVPDGESGEVMESLLTRPGLLLERIVSRGCPTPAGQWYDQDQDEWVLLAVGSATLEIEGKDLVKLQAGDHLLLPAHIRHRVAQVSGDAIWLALHLLRASETVD